MKTKTGTKTYTLSAAALLRCAKLTLLGFTFASGRFIGESYPFGIALVSSASGVDGAACASIGCVIGSFFMPSGLYHAGLTLTVFILRLVLGNLLGGVTDSVTHIKEEGKFPRRKKEDTAQAYALKLVTFVTRKAFGESVYVRMAVSAVASALYGAAECIRSSYAPALLAGAVTSLIASPLFTYLYSAATTVTAEKKKSSAGEAGHIAFALSAVMALREFPLGLDLSVPAAFIITLLVSDGRGTLTGGLYGLVCGCALAPECAPVYVMSSFIYGLMKKTSRAVGVAAACSISCIWSIYAEGLSAMSYTVPSLIITSAVAGPIMSSNLFVKNTRTRSVTASKEKVSEAMLRRETVKKMHALSDCMKDLSGVLHRLSDKLTSPMPEVLCELCESSFEESCSTCGMQSACYGRESEKTASLQAKMTLSLRRDGRISAADIPPAMAKRCYSMGQIIDRMNAGYMRLVSEAKLYDRTSVVAEDYGIISDMLKESADTDIGEFTVNEALTEKLTRGLAGRFSADKLVLYGGRVKRAVAFGVNVSGGTPGADDVRRMFEKAVGLRLTKPEFELDGASVNMILRSRPAFSVKSGRASVASSDIPRGTDERHESSHEDNSETKVFSPASRMGIGTSGSDSCGDVISCFATDDGRFFMLISDGMGSGSEAHATSGVCAVFLEKLLRAGASMDTSLKMLNSMMRVRGREVSATVDLMELDLMTGRTRFVKSGAAPSFVLRGGRLFRLQSKTVPIGIVRALDAELIKFECERGDVIVMLSDGVARSFEDCPWLYDLLCDERVWSLPPDTMARRIIKCAIENGAKDDITAGVVIVE